MKGGCHCGEIRFEVRGKPTWLGRCHCRDCQKISGSAFMAFAEYELHNVQFTKGTPTSYKSSPKVTRTFCGKCGSPIEWKKDHTSDKTSLTLGLFDENPNFDDLDDLYEDKSSSWG